MEISQSQSQKKRIGNNFYTESIIKGAYPLTPSHTQLLKSLYPNQESFIDEIAGALTKDGIVIQATLLAHFVVLRDLFMNKRYGAYAREGLPVSEVKFSFVNVTNAGTLVRYETVEQQMIRRSFLTFNMRSANAKHVKILLAKYDMAMATMGDCGCCIVPVAQLEQLESNALYRDQNIIRSRMNAQAIETLEVEVEELSTIQADIHEDDIRCMKQLRNVIASFASIDEQNGIELPESQREFENAVKNLKKAYSKPI
ncbi:MAG: hypothetical protein CFH44_01048 [Proteobacteria bacterium]|nr:MAG: hypothetical protein CFH44_01048 [Pseudomonadota bacterium]|tara:strand:+ start:626 stop:1393 length:768 start_codon:yes stop_codon:yes gene_type:complete